MPTPSLNGKPIELNSSIISSIINITLNKQDSDELEYQCKPPIHTQSAR